MQIKTYRFIGISPLLMDNVASMDQDLPDLKVGTKPNEGAIDKIAEAKTYRAEDGGLYLKTEALRNSLLDGCKGTKFKGLRIGPATVFQGILFPAEERARLVDADGEAIKTIEPQIDSGVNKSGTKKIRIIVCRARIEHWQVEVPFDIDDTFAPANLDEVLANLLEIWNRAGRVVGVGAWRPQNKGQYGRYRVEEVE